MKLAADHSVVSMDEQRSLDGSFDVTLISKYCNVHTKKKIQAFCFEHKEPCCTLCLTQKHRHCENVKPIDDIQEEFYETSKVSFQGLKSGIHDLLLTKQEQKMTFNENMKATEEEASKFMEFIRCQIESCFEAFVKKLQTYKDEQNTKLNVQIRLLEQLEQNLEHWVNAYAAVRDDGTFEQMFSYLEAVKNQVRARVEELGENFRTDNAISVQFLKDPLVEQLEKVEEIGTIILEHKKLEGQLDKIDTIIIGLGIKCNSNFEKVRFEKEKDFKVPDAAFSCGTLISDTHMVVGCNSDLRLMEKDAADTISSVTGKANILGLCFDKTKNDVLFTCKELKTLFKANISDELNFSSVEEVMTHTSRLGSLSCYDGKVFIVVDDAILICVGTAPVLICVGTTPVEIIKTIVANIRVSNNTGTWISVENDFIVISAFDHEVKGLSFEGDTIFNFKDDAVPRPTAVAHFSDGMYLVISSLYGGSLHLLSSVDKSHKTLIKKFGRTPNGLWVDKKQKAVYVCFKDLIERYIFKATDNK